MKVINKPLLLAYSTITDGNMSFVHGDLEQTLKNREQFLKQNNLNLNKTVWMKTPHQADAHIVTTHDTGKGSTDLASTFPVDALITNQKGIILSLVIADCIPLSLLDPKTQTISLIHVSRHNINTVIKSTIETMEQHFNSVPKNITAEIGPSLGPCCYTWYPGKNPQIDKQYEEFIKQTSPEKGTLDLWGLAEKRLLQQGLKKTKINNPKICSLHSHTYFSHRKFDEQKLEHDYRFAAFISLK